LPDEDVRMNRVWIDPNEISLQKSLFLHQSSEVDDSPIGSRKYCHLPDGSMNVVRSLLSSSRAS
jgi:hypothetical protein